MLQPQFVQVVRDLARAEDGAPAAERVAKEITELGGARSQLGPSSMSSGCPWMRMSICWNYDPPGGE